MAPFELDARGIVAPCEACGQKNRLRYEHLADAVRCGNCKEKLSAPSVPIEIASAADFDRLISHASLPVVVDYWAPWCGPCRMVAPELAKVAARQAGRIVVVKVNTEALPDLGERFAIRSIPTMALFVGGKEAARTTGARPAADIETFINQATQAPSR